MGTDYSPTSKRIAAVFSAPADSPGTLLFRPALEAFDGANSEAYPRDPARPISRRTTPLLTETPSRQGLFHIGVAPVS